MRQDPMFLRLRAVQFIEKLGMTIPILLYDMRPKAERKKSLTEDSNATVLIARVMLTDKSKCEISIERKGVSIEFS